MAEIEWFVGIDWASQSHQVCLVDACGECLGERAVAHGGAGIEELCAWLIARTGATPEVIVVAIETTQGPIAVHALENLGTSDTGITMLRHLLREQPLPEKGNRRVGSRRSRPSAAPGTGRVTLPG